MGTDFDLPTLQSLLGRPPGDTLAELERLEFVVGEPRAGPAEYHFKHTLIQEVAYDSLLFSRRRELHLQIGTYLEITHPDDREPVSEALVYPYGRGRDDG